MSSQIVLPTQIHVSAVIDDSAQIGAGVTIAPYAVIGPNVIIGDGTRVGPHVVIERDTQIGENCRLHNGASLGGDPQDLKYAGEASRLVVGDRTVVREFATLNRGSAARGSTNIGNDCLIMAYAHVAHDCIIGDHVVIANAVNMGGHAEVGDWVVIGGMSAVHQFARIGAHAFIGGMSAVRKDVTPYVKASGNPMRLFGLNAIGLQRRGFTTQVRVEIRRAYRILFQSEKNVRQAVGEVRATLQSSPELEAMLKFIEGSERGVTV
ncbi:MAG: acyl-ACP--UDP-N-acetylglucosamine O-acyltransferase [Longimicrobiales bacterium]